MEQSRQSSEATVDRIIWRGDMPQEFGVSSETIRKWIQAGKLPPPDVDLSRRTRGWRLSTLRAHGINIG